MSWTDGVDRATGDLITSTDWNGYLGASSSLMTLKTHAHGGATGEGSQSLGPLVLEDFTDAAAPAAPGAGKTRIYSTSGWARYRAGASGTDTPLGDKRQSLGTLTGSPAIDFSLGCNVEATLGGNISPSFTNLVAGVWYGIQFTQDGTGGRTVTWPAVVAWPGGTVPTLSALSKTDLFGGYYDGTKLRLSAVLNYS